MFFLAELQAKPSPCKLTANVIIRGISRACFDIFRRSSCIGHAPAVQPVTTT